MNTHIFSVKQQKKDAESLMQKDEQATKVLRLWKEHKMIRNPAEISDTSKGALCLRLLESCSSGLLGYSFNVFTHSLFLSRHLLDPDSSKDGNNWCPSRWKAMRGADNMGICCFFVFFNPFLCLPVMLKFNGLPSHQSLPSFPPEKRWATAHSCSFYPGYHVADTANHRPALSSFKI